MHIIKLGSIQYEVNAKTTIRHLLVWHQWITVLLFRRDKKISYNSLVQLYQKLFIHWKYLLNRMPCKLTDACSERLPLQNTVQYNVKKMSIHIYWINSIYWNLDLISTSSSGYYNLFGCNHIAVYRSAWEPQYDTFPASMSFHLYTYLQRFPTAEAIKNPI